MAREEGRRLKDGRIAFRRATHQEIANRIGTTRETVTRMLKDLERQGLIQVEGRELVVQPDFEKAFELLSPLHPHAGRDPLPHLRDLEPQQAVVEVGLDAVGVDLLGEAEPAREGSVAALQAVEDGAAGGGGAALPRTTSSSPCAWIVTSSRQRPGSSSSTR